MSVGQNDPYQRYVVKGAPGNSPAENSMIDRLNWRGICRAYVCETHAIHQPDVGTRTYHEIFVNAPRNARYVIAEIEGWKNTAYGPRPGSRFVVFDMWGTKETVSESGKLTYFPPVKSKVYHDLDHAIGATIMQYNDTSLLGWWAKPSFVRRLTNIWKEWRLR